MIKIETQNALIAIDRHEGQLHIRQNHSPMELHQTTSQLHLDIELPVLYIDQSQCFAEVGLKGNMELSRHFAAKSRRAGLEGIARIAREGKAMTNIHKGMVIPQLAKQGSTPKEKQLVLEMIPKSRPKIDVVEGKINGFVERGNIDIRLDDFAPKIDYSPTRLDIYLKQKQNIHIEYIGNQLDQYVG